MRWEGSGIYENGLPHTDDAESGEGCLSAHQWSNNDMTQIGYIRGLVVGQYGNPIPLTVVNKLGTAVDISGYSSAVVTIRDPNDLKTVQYAGSFITDGTDGRIRFTPEAGDIDRSGEWSGQIKLAASGLEDYTQPFILNVERKLG